MSCGKNDLAGPRAGQHRIGRSESLKTAASHSGTCACLRQHLIHPEEKPNDGLDLFLVQAS